MIPLVGTSTCLLPNKGLWPRVRARTACFSYLTPHGLGTIPKGFRACRECQGRWLFFRPPSAGCFENFPKTRQIYPSVPHRRFRRSATSLAMSRRKDRPNQPCMQIPIRLRWAIGICSPVGEGNSCSAFRSTPRHRATRCFRQAFSDSYLNLDFFR